MFSYSMAGERGVRTSRFPYPVFPLPVPLSPDSRLTFCLSKLKNLTFYNILAGQVSLFCIHEARLNFQLNMVFALPEEAVAQVKI